MRDAVAVAKLRTLREEWLLARDVQRSAWRRYVAFCKKLFKKTRKKRTAGDR